MAMHGRGAGVGPLVLRFGLAITFIWAGLQKAVSEFEVQGAAAAKLANMGVMVDPAVQNPGQTPPATQPPADAPVLPPEGTPGNAAPPPPPAPVEPAPSDPQPAGQFQTPDTGEPAAPLPPSATSPTQRFVAADFPEPRPVRRVYQLALMIDKAGNPEPDAQGNVPMRLWPGELARNGWPRWLAYSVVIAELGGGICLLIGLLTRIWSFALVGVMLGALWLTQYGPAIASGATKFGFLPDQDWFPMDAWSKLLWQLALLCMALAVVFMGPGILALDNVLFGGRGGGGGGGRARYDEDDDDDE